MTPLKMLKPIHRKQIMKSLGKYSGEERLLSLLLSTMLRQLDKEDLRLPYIAKTLKTLNRINVASTYALEVVEASNKIWDESFKELTINVSIADFARFMVYKRPRQFKKLGITSKSFDKLSRCQEGVDTDANGRIVTNPSGYLFKTNKLVTLMLKKIDEEIAIFDAKYGAENVENTRNG